MKVAITGGEGILGTYVANAFRKKGCHVFPLSHQCANIQDPIALKKVFDECNPDVVVHLGALTDLKICEKDKELAHQINVIGTTNVTEECIKRTIPQVFASTYYIYARNEDGFNSEDVTINEDELPNYYTVTKYQAEQEVKKSKAHYIVRLGSLYGNGEQDKKFIGTLCKTLKAKELINLVDDVFMQPTSSEVAAEKIVELVIRKVPYGTYNVASEGCCSFHQCGSFIAKVMMDHDELIVPISSSDYPVTVKHKYILADSTKLDNVNVKAIALWQKDLSRYIMENFNVVKHSKI